MVQRQRQAARQRCPSQLTAEKSEGRRGPDLDGAGVGKGGVFGGARLIRGHLVPCDTGCYLRLNPRVAQWLTRSVEMPDVPRWRPDRERCPERRPGDSDVARGPDDSGHKRLG